MTPDNQPPEQVDEARAKAIRDWIEIYHKGEKSWPVIEQAAIDHGFDAGLAARPSSEAVEKAIELIETNQWNRIEDGLPKEYNWYEVTVRETSDLGTFDYVDIVSFGHSVDLGLRFDVDPNCTVLAWRERRKPYTAEQEKK